MLVGNLSEAEAERLVCGDPEKDKDVKMDYWPGLISQSSKIPTLTDEKWKKVYDACGGNIMNLSRCVKTAIRERCWDKGKRVRVAIHFFLPYL